MKCMYVNVRMSEQRDVGMHEHMMNIWMYGRVDVAMYGKTREP